MLNQRGQAFSVFELMIAGVVAFAILIILLMVIGGVGTNAYSDAKTVIANAIKTASPSGESSTADFVLKKDETLDVQDLAVKTDLDAGSIYFALGQFNSGNDSLTVDSPAGASFVTYTGPTQKKLNAKVICKQTGTDLDTALARLDTSKYDVGVGGATYCGDSQPCCVVLLTRPLK